MTAEIAVLNKGAVALAADSAVTLDLKSGPKIFNTANKLFTLSKYRPVGIMVYGAAEFMGVPWETIIKAYRKHLGKTKFSALDDYAKHFISFLERKNPFSPSSRQVINYINEAKSYFSFIKSEIDEEVKKQIASKRSVTAQEVKKVMLSKVDEHYDSWRKAKRLPTLPGNFGRQIAIRYRRRIDQAIGEVFEKAPVTKNLRNKLHSIAGDLSFKDIFPGDLSGIVIAGFGEKDTFPRVTAFMLHLKINDRLKYKRRLAESITVENSAGIIPFAQTDMVETFMEGVDPDYEGFIENYLDSLLKGLPSAIVKAMPGLKPSQEKTIEAKLRKLGNTLMGSFMSEMVKYRRSLSVAPIINAVAMLPKDELANMAEALVSLTSFKRRVSLHAETVGGPIDVAVISKGDGFVWIKRKHYFTAELNPTFGAKYFEE